jgi:hypothetical protein
MSRDSDILLVVDWTMREGRRHAAARSSLFLPIEQGTG